MRARNIVALAGVLALAACSSPGQEPPGLTASPSAEETAPTTLSPTPTSETQDLSDPQLGIVFEDVPQLTGDEAAVHNAISTFQVEYWRTMTTNTVSPGMAVIASPEVLANMNRIATSNGADSARIAGTFRTRVSDVQVDGESATAMSCDVYAEVTFEDVNGPATPEQAGFGENFHLRHQLKRSAEGQWVVGGSERTGTC